MSQFRNVWSSEWTGAQPQHECLSCGEVVKGLEGMMNHKCTKEHADAADTSEAEPEADSEWPSTEGWERT